MKHSIVRIMEPKKLFMPIEHKEKFALRTDKRFVWLQRILFLGLKKLGAYDQGTYETMTVHTIDQKDLANKLAVMWNAICQFEDRPPVAVYMGEKEFTELTNNRLSVGMGFSFNLAAHDQGSFRGMRIIVVPWMEGYLPISDNYLP